MFIRQASDLHLVYIHPEFLIVDYTNRVIPPLPEDAETVLVLGGDIGSVRRPSKTIQLLEIVCARFKHVIYLLGNHEHYGETFSLTLSNFEKALVKECGIISNLTLAGNELVKVQIDDVTFLAGTMWTGMNHGEPYIQHVVSNYLNDYSLIYKKVNSTEKITPSDTCSIHYKFLTDLEDQLKIAKCNVVVCTHHLPSFECVDAKYKSSPLALTINHGFASDLNALILSYRPAAWTFGHTHTSYDAKLFDTHLVCNPYGYPQERNFENGVFDPLCRFEV